MDTQVVTAQRMEQKLLDTPAAVDVITAKDIEQSGMTNLPDVLSLVPGVRNFSYGPGGMPFGAMNARSNVRGLDNGTLVLLNGTPMNLSGKVTLSNIPLDIVKRVEVVKGANSTLYGAEAMGGVINIITKDTKKTKVTTTLGVGSHGKRDVGIMASNKDVFMSVERKELGSRDRMSVDRPTTKSKLGYYTALGDSSRNNLFAIVRLSDELSLTTLRSDRHTSFGQLTWDAPTEASRLLNSQYFSYKDKFNHYALNYKNKSGITSNIYYDYQEIIGQTTKKNKKNVLETTLNTSNYKDYHYGWDLQKEWHPNEGKDSVVLGVFAEQEKYQSLHNDQLQGHRNRQAVYAQYGHQWTDRWQSYLGLRGEHATGVAGTRTVVLPQFQSLYKINDKSSWYINVAKGFQMPYVKDIEYSGKLADFSNDLKPQEGWNYETGYKYITDTDAVSVSLYKMDYKNFFTWQKLQDGRSIRVNAGAFKNTGVDVSWKHILTPHWSVTGGVSIMNPEKQKNDKADWEQMLPKRQLSLGVQYQQQAWTTGLSFSYVTGRLKGMYGDENSSIINLNAGVHYQASSNDTVSLQLNNILNKTNNIAVGAYDYWDLPFNATITWKHSF